MGVPEGDLAQLLAGQCCECSPVQCTHSTRTWRPLQDPASAREKGSSWVGCAGRRLLTVCHPCPKPPQRLLSMSSHNLGSSTHLGQDRCCPPGHTWSLQWTRALSQVTICHLYSRPTLFPLCPVSPTVIPSKGPIAIRVSHPLGEMQRTEAEQQPLALSPKTSLVFVALYLLLFSKSREKQTM